MSPTTCCRFCHTPLKHTFVDLGETPLANSYLTGEQLHLEEPTYPLHARVCNQCFLVQVDDVVPPDVIFSRYAYFSSYSTTWMNHARNFVKSAVNRFDLNSESMVVEIASNDGYLLRNLMEWQIPCLGVEPARNVAEIAIRAGIPTEVIFFGRETAFRLAACGNSADLIVANNVLAHVPDLNDFVAGLKILLKNSGVISIECPHLLKLIEGNQFDTIYHEHFSYFSLYTLESVFHAHGLHIFDVEELPTHGGSLRFYICHEGSERPDIATNIQKVRRAEAAAKMNTLEGYTGFIEKVKKTCWDLSQFLTQESGKGKMVAAYGAAAKGNTLLNLCGIKTDRIPFVVDKNPTKQGCYLPGSHILVTAPEKIFEMKPDYLLILPWNIAEEVREQMQDIRTWGGQFITAIPNVKVFT